MSTALPTRPGPAEHSSPRTPRVLACLLCQQRKVKCDRTFPCANCIKHQAQCVPATQTRRRRRRFPERELLDRLRTYEDLLRQNNVRFEPLHKHVAAQEQACRDADGADDSDDEQPGVVGVDSSTESASQTAAGSERVSAAKNWWHAMNQRSPESSDGFDSPRDEPAHHEVREAAVTSAYDHIFDNKDSLLLGSNRTVADLSTLHPEPVHIFRLWQIYLDNVDPLLKVTHTPSLQERIIGAAANMASVAPALEALMFSIYCMSILSLDPDNCQALLGSSRDHLLTRFQLGCQQALSNCEFLRSGDRDCLTALYLYLVSVRPGTDPRSLSSTLGVAIRIAERMGIHNEAGSARCSILESEMRRRLWWSLMLFDSRVGELAGCKTATLSPVWDCRIPLNVNDSDLRAELKQHPTVQGRSSEALFAVVRSELAEHVRHSTFHLDFTSPALKPLARGRQRGAFPEGGEVAALEKMMEEKYLQFCDPNIPLHFMTIWSARGYLFRSRLVEHYSKYSGTSEPQTDAQRDAAISHAFSILDCDTKILSSPLTKGYLWLLHFYFPFPAYVHIAQDLRRRPLIEQAERAWQAMSDNFKARSMFSPTEDSSLFRIFSNIILQAWEARVAAAGQEKNPMEQPSIVSFIYDHLAHVEQDPDKGQPDDAMFMSIDDFAMPTSMGPDDSSLLYSMGWQADSAEAGAEVFSSLPGQTPMNPEIYQFHWAMKGWGLGDR